MGNWEEFKAGFENGLRNADGPDGTTAGPQSCFGLVVLTLFILLACIILGCLHHVLGIPVR